VAYCTIQDVRSVQGLDDVATFPDEVVEAAIAQAEELIDTYCGTSFTVKPFTVTVDGTMSRAVRIPVMYPRSLTSVTVDGEVVPTGDLVDWRLLPEGIVWRPDGVFPHTEPGANITISGTAGVTDEPPAEIAAATRTLTIGNLLQLENRVPDRALAVQSEFGQIQVAQAGGLNRPTEYPSVNAILNRHRHRPPACP
jgi:hypothetical protein